MEKAIASAAESLFAIDVALEAKKHLRQPGLQTRAHNSCTAAVASSREGMWLRASGRPSSGSG